MENRWYSGKQEMHNRRQQKSDEVKTVNLIYFVFYTSYYYMYHHLNVDE